MNMWLRWCFALAAAFIAVPLALAQSIVLDTGGVEFPNGSLQASAVSPATAPLPRSGQASCFANDGSHTACETGIGAGQEGHVQPGVDWPIPRFTKNGDGTVTDNLTGLIWLEHAMCAYATMDFDESLDFAKSLWDGSTEHNGGDCGLSDLSVTGDWRVPTYFEAASLMHHGYTSSGIPDTAGTGQWSAGDPFTEVQNSYWTSTFNPQNKQFGMAVWYNNPLPACDAKTNSHNVWPVRGPVEAALPAAQTAIKLADGGIEFPDGTVQSSAAGPPKVVVPKTGQTSCYSEFGGLITCGGTGQDGELQTGQDWPNPRFTERDDGTVKDNMTGLVWLEDADCNGSIATWDAALSWARNLYDGSASSGGAAGDCGLDDGSLAGEWRLPTLVEFLSLHHMEYSFPALSNTDGTAQWANDDPFLDVRSSHLHAYWTSTTERGTPTRAAFAFFGSGCANVVDKDLPTWTLYAWPVRDDR